MDATNNQMSPSMGQMNEAPGTMVSGPMAHKNKSTSSIIIAVVFIVLAYFGYSWYKQNKMNEAIKAVVTAPDGTLVAGFPKPMIIVNDAVIVLSKQSTIQTPAGAYNLFVAKYTTKSAINGLFIAYVDYMRQNGYTVTQSNLLSEQGSMLGSRMIAGQTETASISITNMNGISTVNIAISNKKL